MAQRGSYAKGIAKREEILDKALEVVAREGYRGASVKEIADAVGLSQAGLLHYFDSKEELFTEILRKRDEVDSEYFASRFNVLHEADAIEKAYVALTRHNSEVPGLVHLFSQLAVDAADPQHAAHEFFVERSLFLRSTFAEALAQRELPEGTDVDVLARIFQAVSDGLQLQWMLEGDVDMAGIIGTLFDLIVPQPAPSTAAD